MIINLDNVTCLSTQIAVERRTKDTRAIPSNSDTCDKVVWLQDIVAEDGISLSYRSQTEEAKIDSYKE